MDLFAQDEVLDRKAQPLATRMRPQILDDIVGQEHILGPGKLLRRAIQADRLGSIILYGPPGCGKTSLAEVIATTTQRKFERTSGVIANVEKLRAIIGAALYRKQHEGTETILFIDEIHRFNKAQQDVLLPHVENGIVTLIGATTHNPLFFVTGPLNSRSQIFELAPLPEKSILELLCKALNDERGLTSFNVQADEDALVHLSRVGDGDARPALNALEIAVLTTPTDKKGVVHITREIAEDSIQKKAVLYDHDEDQHYDTISAFIKSVRGSDPDAALYWLAKMLYAGEDPRFIARRLVILASEDIGNADPRGLTLAVSAMHAVEFVGMPEARIILAQATTYLASAPKSNASYLGIAKALEDVEKGKTLAVPEHLKNIRVSSEAAASPAKGDAGYVYPHNHPAHFVAQEYKPSETIYYEPTDRGYEDVIRKRLEQWRERGTRVGGSRGPMNVQPCKAGQASNLSRHGGTSNVQRVVEEKEKIRAAVREKRKALDASWVEKRSELVQGIALALSEFREARTVCCYLALPDEVQTTRILETCWETQKEVCVPVYGKEADEYCLARLKKGQELVAGRWGVREPGDAVKTCIDEVDMMIVPGLAFDAAGHRLGHGRGYYDRMMSQETGDSLFKLGLAFGFQIFDSIPSDIRDVRLDGVATEREMLRNTQ